MLEHKGVKYNITQEPNPKGKGLIYQYSINLKEPLKKLNASTFRAITKEKATDIHHKMGRIGYADEWARQENIPLLLDVRFWLAVSRKGHQMIEENPEWAKENNYSIDRL